MDKWPTCPYYKCHCLMINPNKFIIYKLSIFYYMNSKCPCNLWKPFWIVIDIGEKDKDEIKWFVCLFKLIWWSMSLMQIWPIKKNNPSCLFYNLLYMDFIFIFTFYLVI